MRKTSINILVKEFELYFKPTISCRLLENFEREVIFYRNQDYGNFDCPYNKFGDTCELTLFQNDNNYMGNEYRICDEKHNCSCSWGYKGLDCRDSKKYISKYLIFLYNNHDGHTSFGHISTLFKL